MKLHSEEWFAKQEARLQEPIKNTQRYYRRSGWIKVWSIFALPWGVSELIRVRKWLNEYIAFQNEYMYNGRMITNDGAPGTGKTFAGSNMAYYSALSQWEKLKSDYFTQRTMRAQWVKNGETDKLIAFKTLEESYLFYAEREATNIPCLVSTLPLREYGTGRMSYVLEPEIFLQIKRAPEYTVFFNDESGQLFGADKSKTASHDANDFWRFYRHFLDAMAVNTNQDGGQNMISIRRSTDYVNHLYGQESLMVPIRLEKRCNRLERRYYKKLNKGKLSPQRAEYLGQELYYLKKYKATIGFRRVWHQMGTPQGANVGEREFYIFPAIGGVQYDDRCYRNQYKCKDKPIELVGWEKLVVEKYDRSEYDEKITGASASVGA